MTTILAPEDSANGYALQRHLTSWRCGDGSLDFLANRSIDFDEQGLLEFRSRRNSVIRKTYPGDRSKTGKPVATLSTPVEPEKPGTDDCQHENDVEDAECAS